MKKHLKTLLTVAVCALICAANVFAQIKTGGYKKIASDNAAVVAAANFAAEDQGAKDNAEITVQSVETAERQTVAGANFKLCLEVFRIEDGDDVEVRQFVQAIVYQNLKKEYTLKSWQEIEDCDAPE